jgi:hypothetical protein
LEGKEAEIFSEEMLRKNRKIFGRNYPNFLVCSPESGTNTGLFSMRLHLWRFFVLFAPGPAVNGP